MNHSITIYFRSPNPVGYKESRAFEKSFIVYYWLTDPDALVLDFVVCEIMCEGLNL